MATITGTSGNDVITGTTDADVIDGGEGNDRLNGGAGDDTLIGGEGTDTLTGDLGNDTLYGGNGNDGFFGGGGNDTLYGDAGNDTMYGDGANDRIYGGDGDDQIFGGSGNDVMDGGAGTNTLNGGTGIDTVSISLSRSALTQTQIDDIFALDAWMQDRIATAGGLAAHGQQNGTASLTLASLGLTVSNVEQLKIFVDGVETALNDLVLNQAPATAATQSVATDEDTAINGVVTATDADGDALAYAVDAGPANGTLTLDAQTGAYTYTPNANYNGADSFKVAVSDGRGGIATQTVNVGVTPVNDAPVTAATTSVTTNEDQAITGQVTGTDVDGDTVGFGVDTGPANGTLTLDAQTGAYTYTPNANYNGADSFKVAVSDGRGGIATQTVNVGVTPVNDAPTAAAAASLATNEDVAISGQVVASDIDGDTLGFSVNAGPANGSLTLDAQTGAYTYTPNANFNGVDSFDVSISDGNGGSATQTVNVGVAAVNDAVVSASAAAIATNEDSAVTGQVTASDIDGDTLSWSMSAAASNGIVTLDAQTGTFSYKPNANYAGTDSFDVTVSDANGSTSTQRVSVTINAVADTPALVVVSPVIIPAATLIAGSNANDIITGTAGVDTIFGNKGNDILDGRGANAITIALDVSAALTDLDGSESLAINVSNMPAGGILSAGVQNTDGTWSLTQADLTGLTISAVITEGFKITVSATSTDSNGSTATASTAIDIQMSSNGNVLYGGNGNDTLHGGSGNDRLYGGNGNDTLYGHDGGDVLDGGKGDDVIYGGQGNDYVYGQSGNDTFYADTGNDVYSAGSGYDTLSYAFVGANINADLSKKTIVGSASGTDIISGSQIEKIIGSAFNDTFKGSSAADTIDAGSGNDWIRGLGGNDILTGGQGSDTFFWEKTDVGTGMGFDRITDFGTGDVLDFRKLVSLGSNSLSSMVRVTDGTAGTTFEAKIGTSFVTIATLDDVHGVTAAGLLASGHLLVG